MTVTTDPRMEAKWLSYPANIRAKLLNLRALILDVAKNTAAVSQLEETLKWGEPSYLAPKGSTIRIDWKAKSPDQYAMYFKCTSRLVATFRQLNGDTFTFEKNRAIIFKLEEKIPETALRNCIKMALRYHEVKYLPLLGE